MYSSEKAIDSHYQKSPFVKNGQVHEPIKMVSLSAGIDQW